MIRIIAVGKIKEKFFEEAIAEYSKRISAYTRLEIVQVQDEKAPEDLSEHEAELLREKEGRRILKAVRDSDYVITLEIKGRQYSSEDFARLMNDLAVSSRPDIVLVIGGSTGLGANVRTRSDLALSFSEMTFPHQLMRVVLLEQIYRSFKINRGEPYHK